MTDQSFTTTITVDRTPEEVYDAVIHPRAWWSDSIEGSAEHVGDRIAFDSPGHHNWRFEVTELVVPEKVVWRVLDSSSTDFVGDPTEWNGTEVRFDISTDAGRTSLRFTHAGLVPEFECFEACSTGWTGYVQRSLRSLLTTGTGEPGAY
ncbi:SRPBCC domain-containing protein [Kribbella sp. NPDC051952]|uniref:SRPBCC family protein n=1 Tax=Kribbella sp. NPDC051952 TaxID=3154851 RepID=UPI003415BC1B